MAMKLKAPIVANIIMLGALTGTGTVPINLDEVKAEIVNSLPPNRVELNLKALNMGYEAIG
jgi:indolepyruvate ferredoxin oxidoreductase beta subunit